MPENVSDITRIAFSPVVDKYLCRRKVYATRSIVVFDDGLNQEIISLFGTVSAEGFGRRQLFDCLMHGFGAGFREGTGYVTNPQPNDVLLRVCYFKSIDLLRYVREQVAPW